MLNAKMLCDNGELVSIVNAWKERPVDEPYGYNKVGVRANGKTYELTGLKPGRAEQVLQMILAGGVFDERLRRISRTVGMSEMDAFRFSPELFEIRTQVIEALNDAGFDWPTQYSSVDPMHDVYGIEVCGIVNEIDGYEIQVLLKRMFPSWRTGCFCFKDYGREPGFKATVQRDMDRQQEDWETA